MDKEHQAFRRYSIQSNSWEDLASDNTLYNGIAGYLTYHKGQNNKDIMVYLGGAYGQLNSYYPPEYPDAALKDSWGSEDVLSSDEHGGRGVASDGEYLYFMGNSREETYAKKIDRYNPNTNFWEESIGTLPVKLDGSAQAVSYNNKLFVVGRNTESDSLFIAYDLRTNQAEMKPAPSEIHFGYTNYNNTFLAYQDYLIYMKSASTTSVSLYVFDIEEDQWLEDPVEIQMNLFSKTSDNASLLLSSSGQLYAAGTKAGEFVLYEVDFSVEEE